jgi:Putative secretion activating protein
MNFDQAFAMVVGNEGGFTNNEADRGNWTSGIVGKGELKGTKFGISAAAYPRLDIANLTLEKAKEIYLLDYWNGCGCDLVPDAVNFVLFDMAVNSGVDAAVKSLQEVLRVQVDGIFGDQTKAALKGARSWLPVPRHQWITPRPFDATR